MKRTLATTIFFILYSLFIHSADTIQLNLSPLVDTYTQTEAGYWEDTYLDGVQIEDEMFRFAHTGSSDGGGGMAYWEGFTLCSSGDTTDYGAEGSSDGWILNQWGCMAGGGADSQGNAVEGAPYLVAYWGFYQEQLTEGYYSLKVDFQDGEAHRCLGTYICNHPWPYYGNINGDGFASGFTNEGDYFALVAHGLNAAGEPTGGTARLILAEFTNGALQQRKDWQWMDLTELGAINGLYFTMETSDADAQYGANTAVYFCLDRLTILSPDTAVESLDRPTGLKALSIGEDSIVLAWNPVKNAEGYRLYLDSAIAGETTDTMFVFTELDAYTEYTLSVEAVNLSDTSEMASLTVTTTDETAPTMPTELTAEPDVHSIALSWQAAEDNVGVKRYTVYLDGEAYKRQTLCSLTLVGLDADTEYLIEVEAEDEVGNKSERTSLRTRTLPEETALQNVEKEESDRAVYTIDGRYLGTDIPSRKGTYILKTQTTTQIVIH